MKALISLNITDTKKLPEQKRGIRPLFFMLMKGKLQSNKSLGPYLVPILVAVIILGGIFYLPNLKIYILCISVLMLLLGATIIFLQDLHLYPKLLQSYFESKVRTPVSLPENVQSYFLDTNDGKRVEAWYLPAENVNKDTPTAIIFHGNKGAVDTFFRYQEWLRDLGISSWAMEYRGFGKSTGWPSEERIYSDAEALLDFVKQKTAVPIPKLVIVGISLGTGPASYLALKSKADILLTFAAYTSIPEAAKTNSPFPFLVRFMRTKFPVKNYIRELTNTKVIAIHGKKDYRIPFEHLNQLKDAYSGAGGFFTIIREEGLHSDMLDLAKDEVSKNLLARLKE